MGQKISHTQFSNPVNYDCPVCQQSGKMPNLGGRFFIINLKECQCNGCNSIFEKNRFYKPVVVGEKIPDNEKQIM
jgi:hypothetical protein